MNRALAIALVVVTVLALVAGFATVGGPFQARMEKIDRERAGDLSAIVNALACDDPQGPLPTELITDAIRTVCPGMFLVPRNLTDPETGEDYAYRVTDEKTFEVCAEFYDPAMISDENLGYYPRSAEGIAFENNRGCIKGKLSER